MAKATAQFEFYVAKGEQQLGPWTVQEIATKLAAGELAVTDFVFDDDANDWVAVFQSAAFQAGVNKEKPKSAPLKTKISPALDSGVDSSVDRSERQDWFVQKGQHRYGPFTFLGVIRALQEKTIYEFDLCWKNGMDEWIRIAEHESFQEDKIRALTSEAQTEERVFAQRQHPRIGFETEVLVHDNRSVWLGRAFEGSAGGSGLVIENSTLVPGQTVLLHFAEATDLPAFNALCEIVGKKFAKDVRDPKSPVQYSVRFVKLDAQAEARVQKYFQAV